MNNASESESFPTGPSEAQSESRHKLSSAAQPATSQEAHAELQAELAAVLTPEALSEVASTKVETAAKTLREGTQPSLNQKPPIIELKGVSKWFPDKPANSRLVALENLSLVIPDEEAGEFVAVLGPSGCGKSTILQLIAGLITPDQGEVRIMGNQVRGDNGLSVMVQQAYTCFPWLTVLGNVEFGLGIQGKPKDERRHIAVEYLRKVGLGDRQDAYPRQLSGGMQQRVAIARTLALKPPIVLMDEPFGALDAQTRSEMQQMLLQLWEEEKNLIFFITHDITEALLLADRIIVLSPRPAEIIRDLKVPFARPRRPDLAYDEHFIALSQELLQLLKHTPTSGQVRVSV